jgi:hypothetical protein
VKIFGHGHGDADGERIGVLAVAVEDEVAGDSALGNVDCGAGGPAEGNGREDVADAGVGDAVTAGVEMSSE